MIKKYTLNFKLPARTSRGVMLEKETWFLLIEKNGRIGIGECGNTSQNATKQSKIKMINRYYSMPKYTDNFIGGYFWWYWVQDCVPYKNNEVWSEISNNMR